MLATLLDPHYKAHVFTAADTLDKAKQWIEEHATASVQPEATLREEGQGPTSPPKPSRK